MSRFILSCTTCATRMPGRDEISECFILAPKAGYKAWGAQSPLFWWPGLTRWANIDLINACAAEAGLERCTEVYGAAFPTGSVAEAQRPPATGLSFLMWPKRWGARWWSSPAARARKAASSPPSPGSKRCCR